MSNMKNRNDLAKYFAELGFKVGAEIGVDRGEYSEILCKANPELKLYCIDAWGLNEGRSHNLRVRRHEEAKAKLAPYNTVLINKFSMDAVRDFEDRSLDFVYIDAAHRFDRVMEDIIFWGQKVRKGGIISGHDYSSGNGCGVKDAVDVYVKHHHYDLEVLPEANAHWILRDGTPSEALTWWFKKKWN